MATPAIALNPMQTTNGAGLFSATTSGLVQGTVMDDPAARFALATGYVAPTETIPMYPGIAITENIPNDLNFASGTPDRAYGPSLARATSQTGITNQVTGFTCINQFHNGIVTPQSRAPTAGSYMSIGFYRLGSGARIVLACDASLVSLLGGSSLQQVSWDFNNQIIQPYDASTATYSLTSVTSSFNSATGVYTFACVAAGATPVAAVGDYINISGVTGTGAVLVNGNQQITAFTDNQHFSFQVTAASGAIATGSLSGTIVLNYGTGALPVKVIDGNFGNSRTIVWNPVTQTANWIENGNALVVVL